MADNRDRPRYRIRLVLEDLDGAEDGYTEIGLATFPVETLADGQRGYRNALSLLSDFARYRII